MAGWNGSGMGGNSTPVKPKVAAKKPSPIRGIVGGGLVCVLVVGAYFAFFSGSEKPQTEKVEKERGRIKEVTPAAAPTNKVVEVAKPDNKMRDHDEMTIAQLRKLPLSQCTEKDCMRLDPTFSNRLERFKREQAEIPWATTVDRELALLLFPKDNNTGLLIPFDSRFKDRFLKSLSTPTLVLSTDSEELKEQKRELNELKAGLKREIDAGADVTQLLNEEYERLKKVNGLQSSMQRELREYARTAESYDDIEDFVAAANIMLKERGGKEMKVPFDIKLKYGKPVRNIKEEK